jgi:hypothetical protein
MSAYSLKEAIKLGLLSNAALAALVGDRVWSQFAPGEVVDKFSVWVVYEGMSGGEVGSMDGNNNLSYPRFQFTVGGADPLAVNEVFNILRLQFNGYEYSYTVEAVTYRVIFLHLDDRDGWADSSRLYRPTVDLQIWAEN